jgi:hypothetical protein
MAVSLIGVLKHKVAASTLAGMLAGACIYLLAYAKSIQLAPDGFADHRKIFTLAAGSAAIVATLIYRYLRSAR